MLSHLILMLFYCAFSQVLPPEVVPLYVQLDELARRSSFEIPLPKIAVIGVQAAGKTTFIETYIGFRIGFTSRGTGTRCPVRYTLINNLKLLSPETYIIVNEMKMKVPYQQLADKVAEHMKMLENTVLFSEEFLDIIIESASVPNIQFVDVPGIVPEGSTADKQLIEKIVAKVARDPSYMLIVIVKATEDPTTITDLTLVDRVLKDEVYSNMDSTIPLPRAKWQEDSVIIVNRFNLVVEAQFIADIRDANDYFSKSLQSMYFVNLAPDKNLHRDSATFAQVEAMLKDFTNLEATWFSDWKDKLNSGGKAKVWNPSNDLILGVEQAKKHITQKWLALINKSFPQMLRKCENDLLQVKKKLAEANEELNRTNIPALRKIYSDYAVSFLVYLKTTMKAKLVLPDEDDADIVEDYPSSIARTFLDDLAASRYGNKLESKSWSFFIPIDKLLTPDHLLGHRLGDDMEKLLYGHAAVDRLRRVFSYFLVARDFADYSDNKILNLAYNPQDAAKGQFPVPDVVVQLAQDQINKAKKGIDWFLDTLLDIYASYCSSIHQLLLSRRKYSGLQTHAKFQEMIDTTYLSLVGQRIDRIKSRWREDTTMYSRKIDVDITVRGLMALMLNPLENIMIQSFHVPQVFEDIEKQDKVQLLGKHETSEIRDTLAPTERILQKKQLVDDFRKTLYSYISTLGYCDFVDGGLVALPPQDWNSIDYVYLRNAAKEFYFNIITRLVFHLDAMLNYYFVDLVVEDPEREIQQALLLRIFSLSDEEIGQMSNIDPIGAKKRAEEAQKEYDDILPVIPLLRQTMSALSNHRL